MPNHWHLLLWPREDGELSETMRWLTVTHSLRWHAHRHTAGTGPVYQGRFKSFPVQNDGHFLAVARYVERNALRANLVEQAEEWRWSSLWRRQNDTAWAERVLHRRPVTMPSDWVRRVNRAMRKAELEAIRSCVKRGCPYGGERWTQSTVVRLGLESTQRPQCRPRKNPEPK